jgi:phosphatidylglycerol lysyltransferase
VEPPSEQTTTTQESKDSEDDGPQQLEHRTGKLTTRKDQRGLWPRLFDYPGRLIQNMVRAPRPLGDGSPDLQKIAKLAEQSPRANAYLSVDSELRAYECDAGVVTFATSGRTAFVVGGPHTGGNEQMTKDLLNKFQGAAKAVGYRRILLFPLLGDQRHLADNTGFETIETGSEAFIDLDEFTLRGKEFADLRQMRNRAQKRYNLSVDELDPESDRQAMTRVYRSWLEERPSRHRMTLVVGRPQFDRPLGRRYFGVRDDSGLRVFLTLVPCFDGRGWGVDVMARPGDAPAGAMDLLISETALAVRDEGAELFSVGACPMALKSEESARHRPLLRAAFRYLYGSKLGNRLFNFQSLHRYKMKFNPRWEPVCLAAWPRVSAAGLYVGCGMWGLFGAPWRTSPRPAITAAPSS